MGFLLAKIAFLLVLVSAVTAWLTRWWVFRQFEDVTESYSSMLHRTGGAEVGGGGHALLARFDAIEERLAPLQTQLAAIEETIASLPTSFPDIPTPPPVDLGPLMERLTALEATVEALPALIAEPAAVDGLAQERRPGGGRNLLRRPAFGAPDALKKMKGVGPKLEGMLHDIGVYYFWQVAQWDTTDVSHIDDLLPAFRGRIKRDDWVRQAVELAAEPESAKAPA